MYLAMMCESFVDKIMRIPPGKVQCCEAEKISSWMLYSCIFHIKDETDIVLLQLE